MDQKYKVIVETKFHSEPRYVTDVESVYRYGLDYNPTNAHKFDMDSTLAERICKDLNRRFSESDFEVHEMMLMDGTVTFET